MKRALLVTLFFSCALCFGMEEERDVVINIDDLQEEKAPLLEKAWRKKIVSCIIKRKPNKLDILFANAPTTRSSHKLNNKIFEELKAHREQELEALQATFGYKKIWNKFRAIVIDLGLPVAGTALGIVTGVIEEKPVLWVLALVYGVLSSEMAIKQAYAHWTMKEYEGKVEEFDVWLKLLENTQNLNQKGYEDKKMNGNE